MLRGRGSGSGAAGTGAGTVTLRRSPPASLSPGLRLMPAGSRTSPSSMRRRAWARERSQRRATATSRRSPAVSAVTSSLVSVAVGMRFRFVLLPALDEHEEADDHRQPYCDRGVRHVEGRVVG